MADSCIFDVLALSLPFNYLDDPDVISLSAQFAEDPEILALAAKAPGPCTMSKDPAHPGHNWVTETGGLPNYICQIARAVHRKIPDTGQAIAIAVGTVKRWSVDPKRSASVRARAAEAVASWEAKRGAAHGEHAVKKVLRAAKDDGKSDDSKPEE